ncbi:Hypothetical predicted protein, partial [Paramuricea clavata]
MTEENELLKATNAVYHEDFDKERFEKEDIQSIREHERGQLAELQRQIQLLTEQLDNERLQRGSENQRLGELERENISLRAQLDDERLQQDVEKQRLEGEVASLKQQLDNERLQRGRENQRRGELERENISLREQ